MSASPNRQAAVRPVKLLAGALALLAAGACAGTASAHLPDVAPPSATAPALSPAIEKQAAADPGVAQVILSCMVVDQGAVKDCAIVSEDPAGSGYGEAALQMASQFKLTLKSDGGVAVPGERMTIPVRIRIAK